MVRQLSTNPKSVYNREYNRRKRAERKATMMANSPDIDEPHDITEDIPLVEVAIPTEKSKLSLKERLMGKVKQPSSNKGGRRAKKVDSNLMTQLAPTLVATFIATYSRQMIPDPYKMCAPSQDEILAMVAPYFNILSRYVEITGHASENVLDLINAVLASVMYGTRAYVTYIMIKEDKTHESPDELMERRRSEYREGLEREAVAINANSIETTGLTRDSGNENPNAQDGLPNDEKGNRIDSRSEAARVAQLFERDTEGRRRLGLV